jgi:hypothetical protein
MFLLDYSLRSCALEVIEQIQLGGFGSRNRDTDVVQLPESQ